MGKQLILDVHDKLIVDLFAGGGGMSVAFESAFGRSPDIAINHNDDALSMHRMNHPLTRHFIADVYEVDPHGATQGRPVGWLHLSPDCTHHSKASGGQKFSISAQVRMCGNSVDPAMATAFLVANAPWLAVRKVA